MRIGGGDIVEVSKKHSPTGQRYLTKTYPKDNEPRVFGVRQARLDAISERIQANGIGPDTDQRNLDPLTRIQDRRT